MGPYRGVKPPEAGSHFPSTIASLATGEGASAYPPPFPASPGDVHLPVRGPIPARPASVVIPPSLGG